MVSRIFLLLFSLLVLGIGVGCGRIRFESHIDDGGLPRNDAGDGSTGTDADSGADSATDAVLCDLDDDGFLALTCGGDDCNDTDPSIAPGGEGPVGDGSCADGVDNDCDGAIDDADSSCRPADIFPLRVSLRPVLSLLEENFGAGGGRVYFAATDGTTGTELWVTDGTGVGTQMLGDINPTGDSNPSFVRVASDRAFFFADDGTNGRELWVTDGTPAGTRMVHDINTSGSSVRYHSPALAGDLLIFQADDGVNGREPWVSDGTSLGTHLLVDLAPGLGSSHPYEIHSLDSNTVVFAATVAPTGIELWRSDGTAAGTRLIVDANPGAGASLPGGWYRYFGGDGEGVVYYRGTDGSGGLELWRTDGTALGTLAVSDIMAGAGDGVYGAPHLAVVGGRVFFSGTGPNGGEPYVSDGTLAGTVLLSDVNPSGDSQEGEVAYQFTESGGLVFFSADDGTTGQEPWVTDGSPAGTRPLANIHPTGSSFPGSLFHFRGELWFSADDGVNGIELWKTDGTEANTILAHDFNPTGDGFPFHIGSTSSWALLAGNGGAMDSYLWVLR